jgi:hypothetical protein
LPVTHFPHVLFLVLEVRFGVLVLYILSERIPAVEAGSPRPDPDSDARFENDPAEPIGWNDAESQCDHAPIPRGNVTGQIGAGKPRPYVWQRNYYERVIRLVRRLREAVQRLNHNISDEVQAEALRKVLRIGTPNRNLQAFISSGVFQVSFCAGKEVEGRRCCGYASRPFVTLVRVYSPKGARMASDA